MNARHRVVAAITASAAVSIVIAAGGLASAGGEKSIDFSVQLPILEQSSGPGNHTFAETSDKFPVVGKATLGTFTHTGCLTAGCTVATSFSMNFSNSAGTLSLQGTSDASTQPILGNWTVLSGTGRYAKWSGSGTFAASWDTTFPLGTEQLTVSGLLAH
jgi:hypothetical protein